MPSRRTKKRNYRTITFKVYFDDDEDILDWWEDIEAGERSDTIRDVIREYIGVQPKRKPKVIDLPELMEVRRDTLWIKDALNDMPAYLERVIQHVVTNAQPIAVGQTLPRASPIETVNDDPALTDAESQRRTNRMRKATW
ncbi:MAG: hypothetical protein RLP44_23055 [Aggregatilineales bacterium]